MHKVIQNILSNNIDEALKLLKDECKQALSNPSETSLLIDTCISTDNMSVLEFVLTNAHYEKSDEIRTNGLSILHEACIQGHIHAVRYLIKKGHDINAEDKQKRISIFYAAHEGYTEIVEVFLRKLLDTGASVKVSSWVKYTLSGAVNNGHTETVRVLLKAVAKVNDLSWEHGILIEPAKNGHTEIIQLLINAGANVNAPFRYYYSNALIEAARNGHTDTVETLITAGADVNSKDFDGDTALTLANKYQYTAIIELLETRKSLVDDAFQSIIVKNKSLSHFIGQGVSPNAKKLRW